MGQYLPASLLTVGTRLSGQVANTWHGALHFSSFLHLTLDHFRAWSRGVTHPLGNPQLPVPWQQARAEPKPPLERPQQMLVAALPRDPFEKVEEVSH